MRREGGRFCSRPPPTTRNVGPSMHLPGGRPPRCSSLLRNFWRDPELGDAASSVIHGEQRFGWVRPIPVEADLLVTGNVSRVRSRGGVWFTSFEFEARDDTGAGRERDLDLLDGWWVPAGILGRTGRRSLHLAAEAPTIPCRKSRTAFPAFRRSASRSDLIRYAGATADWNPVHWDHESAVAAGLSDDRGSRPSPGRLAPECRQHPLRGDSAPSPRPGSGFDRRWSPAPRRLWSARSGDRRHGTTRHWRPGDRFCHHGSPVTP